MTRPHTTATPFDVTGLHDLPRVDIAYAYGGADGVLVDAARVHGAAGLVLVGFGGGSYPQAFPTPAYVPCKLGYRWCSPPAQWLVG